MNKLYILGALVLSQVEGLKLLASGVTLTTAAASIPSGQYIYNVKGDCLDGKTATTLGMNNKYYQYYTYDVDVGTRAFAAASPSATTSPNYVLTYNACYHTHLYNWMAVPQVGTAAIQAGLATAVVAYGYVLTGTAVTSCANTIATGTLYSSTAKTFSGAQYQHVSIVFSLNASPATTIAQYARVKQGTEGTDGLITKAGTVYTFSATSPLSDGLAISTTPNHYWDFMQTNVFQGMTQFGRGGGASTAPCGWYVVYAHEQPAAYMGIAGSTTAGLATGTEDAYPSSLAKATIHMWSDNSIMTVASSIVLSALATILF